MSTYISIELSEVDVPKIPDALDVAVDMIGRDVRISVTSDGDYTGMGEQFISPQVARDLAAQLVAAADECERRARD